MLAGWAAPSCGWRRWVLGAALWVLGRACWLCVLRRGLQLLVAPLLGRCGMLAGRPAAPQQPPCSLRVLLPTPARRCRPCSPPPAPRAGAASGGAGGGRAPAPRGHRHPAGVAALLRAPRPGPRGARHGRRRRGHCGGGRCGGHDGGAPARPAAPPGLDAGCGGDGRDRRPLQCAPRLLGARARLPGCRCHLCGCRRVPCWGSALGLSPRAEAPPSRLCGPCVPARFYPRRQAVAAGGRARDGRGLAPHPHPAAQLQAPEPGALCGVDARGVCWGLWVAQPALCPPVAQP